MSLLEQSVDSIELAKKKKKEKDLKKQCLENNLRVKISKLDIQNLQDEVFCLSLKNTHADF